MGSMFSGCSGLTSLDVSGFDTSKVTNMGGMFNGCSKLSSLDLSKWITSNVTDMSYMFQSCSGLTSLDLRRFDTSLVGDAAGMFSGCINLESLSWTNWKPSVDVSSTSLTQESTKDIVSKLATVTESKTLTLGYTLLSYLTEDEIITTTNKGWSLVG
jgi:surface protein